MVDAWSTFLETYSDFLQKFDTAVLWNNAVIVPRNDCDEDTSANRAKLEAKLQLTFRSKYAGPQIVSPRFRTDINTIEDFRSALLSVLEMIRTEIETHRAAQLKIRGSRSLTYAPRGSSPMADDAAGRIITFYSYKGGTGRTMALANAAWVLASSGHRVLMIDWDLEAPGLHRCFHPFLSDKTLVGTRGVIDMVYDYQRLLLAREDAMSLRELPDDWYDRRRCCAREAPTTSRLLARTVTPRGRCASTLRRAAAEANPAALRSPAHAA